MKPKLDVRVRMVESNSMEVVIAIENCMQKKLCQNEMYPSQKTTIRAKRIATLRSLHTHTHTHLSHNFVLFHEIYLFNAREEKNGRKRKKGKQSNRKARSIIVKWISGQTIPSDKKRGEQNKIFVICLVRNKNSKLSSEKLSLTQKSIMIHSRVVYICRLMGLGWQKSHHVVCLEGIFGALMDYHVGFL